MKEEEDSEKKEEECSEASKELVLSPQVSLGGKNAEDPLKEEAVVTPSTEEAVAKPLKGKECSVHNGNYLAWFYQAVNIALEGFPR